jgi:hypothetical protein
MRSGVALWQIQDELDDAFSLLHGLQARPACEQRCRSARFRV